jgi:hypothetical protein
MLERRSRTSCIRLRHGRPVPLLRSPSIGSRRRPREAVARRPRGSARLRGVERAEGKPLTSRREPRASLRRMRRAREIRPFRGRWPASIGTAPLYGNEPTKGRRVSGTPEPTSPTSSLPRPCAVSWRRRPSSEGNVCRRGNGRARRGRPGHGTIGIARRAHSCSRATSLASGRIAGKGSSWNGRARLPRSTSASAPRAGLDRNQTVRGDRLLRREDGRAAWPETLPPARVELPDGVALEILDRLIRSVPTRIFRLTYLLFVV